MTFHHPSDESRLPSVTSSLIRLSVRGLLLLRLKEAGDIRFVSHFIFPFFIFSHLLGHGSRPGGAEKLFSPAEEVMSC